MECEECGEEMKMLDAKETEKQGEEAFDHNGDLFIAWKPADCKFVTFGVCSDCLAIQVQCNKCGEMCQFLGHMGFHVNGSQYSRNFKNKKITELPDDVPVKDKTQPRYCITDLGKMIFKMDQWYPSGPSGTEPHFWYCPECKVDYNFCEA